MLRQPGSNASMSSTNAGLPRAIASRTALLARAATAVARVLIAMLSGAAERLPHIGLARGWRRISSRGQWYLRSFRNSYSGALVPPC